MQTEASEEQASVHVWCVQEFCYANSENEPRLGVSKPLCEMNSQNVSKLSGVCTLCTCYSCIWPNKFLFKVTNALYDSYTIYIIYKYLQIRDYNEAVRLK
jgi:hypothetical protein